MHQERPLIQIDLSKYASNLHIVWEDISLGIVDNFLSAEECAALIAAAEDKYRVSRIVLPDGIKPDPRRTSMSAFLTEDAADDATVLSVYKRLTDMFDNMRTDPMQLHRYQPGQQFEEHYDWFDPVHAERIEREGQRAWTCIVYLNDDCVGGNTNFPRGNLSLQPRRGRMVFWRNVDSFGYGLEDALHAGMPVEEGTKYLLSLWVRDKQL